MADNPPPRDDSAQHPNPVAAQGGGQAQAVPSVPSGTDAVPVRAPPSATAAETALHHGVDGGIQDNSAGNHQGGTQRSLGDDRRGATSAADGSLSGHNVAAAEPLGVAVNDQLAADPSGLSEILPKP